MTRVSAVVPVKDGEAFLEELLAALAHEGVDEVLVIDSGSRDASLAIARAAGVELAEIAPGEFGHGRTRNLGAERTSGDLIWFLTQDATPVPGALAAYREAFGLGERVGAAFGPHLARPDTSPMIARELEEFFEGFAGPGGGPALQRAGDEPFLSNVNACYARACWEEIRFEDVAYAEDQAFGRALLAAGWDKAYHPGAAVLHAHDYPPLDFMRRYFDEYRGLRASSGHVERIGVRSTVRDVRALTAADARWMRERGMPAGERARWTARAALHHGGRKVFSALGSNAQRLPDGLERRLSLEGRASGDRNGHVAGDAVALPTKHVPAQAGFPFEAVGRFLHDGAAPLLDPLPGMAGAERLHVAVVVPSFKRGSGGHSTIFQIVKQLEALGHTCSIWLHDPPGWQSGEWPAVVRREIVEHFHAVRAPVFKEFGEWYGADVVLATGWQTVYPVLTLPHCRARAYFVQDHEPEFYGTSMESLWAERTYREGLHCICASPWLADLVRDRYGASATHFLLGVDRDVYHPRAVARRRDTVAFYARAATTRRAVPLGALALAELVRRRPELRVVTFGDAASKPLPFAHEFAGVASPAQLAGLYSEATAGIVMSLTNYSLIPQEMLACGLPCVDLAGSCSEAVFGADGPVELAPADPRAIADRIEALLDDETLWQRRHDAGLAYVADKTWERAARDVEAGLRTALRAREQG